VYNKGKRIAEDVTLQVALTNGIIKGKPLVYSYYMEEIPVTQKEQGILIKYPKVISGSERKQEVYLITTQKEEPVIDVWHGAEIIKPEEQVFNRSWIEHVLIFSGLFLWSLLVVVPVMYIIFASLGYF
jgi:hypothetical protein